MKSKKLFSDIFIYTSFGAFEKIIPFFVLPFLTRFFSMEDIGYYTLYQTIIVLLVPIITCEVGTTIFVNYWHYSRYKFSVSLYNGILGCFSLFCLVSLLFFIVGHQVSCFVKFPFYEFLLAIFTIPFVFLSETLQCLYRNQNKPISFGIFSSIRSVLCYGIGIVLILWFHWSWTAFVIANLIGNILSSIWVIFYLYKERFWTFKFDKSLFWENVKVGYPVSLHIIGTWLSTTVNQMLVNICIGIAATGMYGVGATFGMIMSFIQTSLNKAYTPMLFSNLKEDKYGENKQMIIILYFIILLSFLGVTLVGYYGVEILFGSSYAETRRFIMPLVLCSALQGLYKIHAAFLFYFKRTIAITKITLSLGLLNVPLAYFMLKEFGIQGAAYSSVIVWALSYLLVYVESTKVYDYHRI